VVLDVPSALCEWLESCVYRKPFNYGRRSDFGGRDRFQRNPTSLLWTDALRGASREHGMAAFNGGLPVHAGGLS